MKDTLYPGATPPTEQDLRDAINAYRRLNQRQQVKIALRAKEAGRPLYEQYYYERKGWIWVPKEG